MTIDNAKNSLLIPWSLVTAMMPSEVSSPQLLVDLNVSGRWETDWQAARRRLLAAAHGFLHVR